MYRYIVRCITKPSRYRLHSNFGHKYKKVLDQKHHLEKITEENSESFQKAVSVESTSQDNNQRYETQNLEEMEENEKVLDDLINQNREHSMITTPSVPVLNDFMVGRGIKSQPIRYTKSANNEAKKDYNISTLVYKPTQRNIYVVQIAPFSTGQSKKFSSEEKHSSEKAKDYKTYKIKEQQAKALRQCEKIYRSKHKTNRAYKSVPWAPKTSKEFVGFVGASKNDDEHQSLVVTKDNLGKINLPKELKARKYKKPRLNLAMPFVRTKKKRVKIVYPIYQIKNELFPGKSHTDKKDSESLPKKSDYSAPSNNVDSNLKYAQKLNYQNKAVESTLKKYKPKDSVIQKFEYVTPEVVAEDVKEEESEEVNSKPLFDKNTPPSERIKILMRKSKFHYAANEIWQEGDEKLQSSDTNIISERPLITNDGSPKQLIDLVRESSGKKKNLQAQEIAKQDGETKSEENDGSEARTQQKSAIINYKTIKENIEKSLKASKMNIARHEIGQKLPEKKLVVKNIFEFHQEKNNKIEAAKNLEKEIEKTSNIANKKNEENAKKTFENESAKRLKDSRNEQSLTEISKSTKAVLEQTKAKIEHYKVNKKETLNYLKEKIRQYQETLEKQKQNVAGTTRDLSSSTKLNDGKSKNDEQRTKLDNLKPRNEDTVEENKEERKVDIAAATNDVKQQQNEFCNNTKPKNEDAMKENKQKQNLMAKNTPEVNRTTQIELKNDARNEAYNLKPKTEESVEDSHKTRKTKEENSKVEVVKENVEDKIRADSAKKFDLENYTKKFTNQEATAISKESDSSPSVAQKLENIRKQSACLQKVNAGPHVQHKKSLDEIRKFPEKPKAPPPRPKNEKPPNKDRVQLPSKNKVDVKLSKNIPKNEDQPKINKPKFVEPPQEENEFRADMGTLLAEPLVIYEKSENKLSQNSAEIKMVRSRDRITGKTNELKINISLKMDSNGNLTGEPKEKRPIIKEGEISVKQIIAKGSDSKIRSKIPNFCEEDERTIAEKLIGSRKEKKEPKRKPKKSCVNKSLSSSEVTQNTGNANTVKILKEDDFFKYNPGQNFEWQVYNFTTNNVRKEGDFLVYNKGKSTKSEMDELFMTKSDKARRIRKDDDFFICSRQLHSKPDPKNKVKTKKLESKSESNIVKEGEFFIFVKKPSRSSQNFQKYMEEAIGTDIKKEGEFYLFRKSLTDINKIDKEDIKEGEFFMFRSKGSRTDFKNEVTEKDDEEQNEMIKQGDFYKLRKQAKPETDSTLGKDEKLHTSNRSESKFDEAKDDTEKDHEDVNQMVKPGEFYKLKKQAKTEAEGTSRRHGKFFISSRKESKVDFKNEVKENTDINQVVKQDDFYKLEKQAKAKEDSPSRKDRNFFTSTRRESKIDRKNEVKDEDVNQITKEDDFYKLRKQTKAEKHSPLRKDRNFFTPTRRESKIDLKNEVKDEDVNQITKEDDFYKLRKQAKAEEDSPSRNVGKFHMSNRKESKWDEVKDNTEEDDEGVNKMIKEDDFYKLRNQAKPEVDGASIRDGKLSMSSRRESKTGLKYEVKNNTEKNDDVVNPVIKQDDFYKLRKPKSDLKNKIRENSKKGDEEMVKDDVYKLNKQTKAEEDSLSKKDEKLLISNRKKSKFDLKNEVKDNTQRGDEPLNPMSIQGNLYKQAKSEAGSISRKAGKFSMSNRIGSKINPKDDVTETTTKDGDGKNQIVKQGDFYKLRNQAKTEADDMSREDGQFFTSSMKVSKSNLKSEVNENIEGNDEKNAQLVKTRDYVLRQQAKEMTEGVSRKHMKESIEESSKRNPEKLDDGFFISKNDMKNKPKQLEADQVIQKPEQNCSKKSSLSSGKFGNKQKLKVSFAHIETTKINSSPSQDMNRRKEPHDIEYAKLKDDKELAKIEQHVENESGFEERSFSKVSRAEDKNLQKGTDKKLEQKLSQKEKGVIEDDPILVVKITLPQVKGTKKGGSSGRGSSGTLSKPPTRQDDIPGGDRSIKNMKQMENESAKNVQVKTLHSRDSSQLAKSRKREENYYNPNKKQKYQRKYGRTPPKIVEKPRSSITPNRGPTIKIGYKTKLNESKSKHRNKVTLKYSNVTKKENDQKTGDLKTSLSSNPEIVHSVSAKIKTAERRKSYIIVKCPEIREKQSSANLRQRDHKEKSLSSKISDQSLKNEGKEGGKTHEGRDFKTEKPAKDKSSIFRFDTAKSTNPKKTAKILAAKSSHKSIKIEDNKINEVKPSKSEANLHQSLTKTTDSTKERNDGKNNEKSILKAEIREICRKTEGSPTEKVRDETLDNSHEEKNTIYRESCTNQNNLEETQKESSKSPIITEHKPALKAEIREICKKDLKTNEEEDQLRKLEQKLEEQNQIAQRKLKCTISSNRTGKKFERNENSLAEGVNCHLITFAKTGKDRRYEKPKPSSGRRKLSPKQAETTKSCCSFCIPPQSMSSVASKKLENDEEPIIEKPFDKHEKVSGYRPNTAPANIDNKISSVEEARGTKHHVEKSLSKKMKKTVNKTSTPTKLSLIKIEKLPTTAVKLAKLQGKSINKKGTEDTKKDYNKYMEKCLKDIEAKRARDLWVERLLQMSKSRLKKQNRDEITKVIDEQEKTDLRILLKFLNDEKKEGLSGDIDIDYLVRKIKEAIKNKVEENEGSRNLQTKSRIISSEINGQQKNKELKKDVLVKPARRLEKRGGSLDTSKTNKKIDNDIPKSCSEIALNYSKNIQSPEKTKEIISKSDPSKKVDQKKDNASTDAYYGCIPHMTKNKEDKKEKGKINNQPHDTKKSAQPEQVSSTPERAQKTKEGKKKHLDVSKINDMYLVQESGTTNSKQKESKRPKSQDKSSKKCLGVSKIKSMYLIQETNENKAGEAKKSDDKKSTDTKRCLDLSKIKSMYLVQETDDEDNSVKMTKIRDDETVDLAKVKSMYLIQEKDIDGSTTQTNIAKFDRSTIRSMYLVQEDAQGNYSRSKIQTMYLVPDAANKQKTKQKILTYPIRKAKARSHPNIKFGRSKKNESKTGLINIVKEMYESLSESKIAKDSGKKMTYEEILHEAEECKKECVLVKNKKSKKASSGVFTGTSSRSMSSLACHFSISVAKDGEEGQKKDERDGRNTKKEGSELRAQLMINDEGIGKDLTTPKETKVEEQKTKEEHVKVKNASENARIITTKPIELSKNEKVSGGELKAQMMVYNTDKISKNETPKKDLDFDIFEKMLIKFDEDRVQDITTHFKSRYKNKEYYLYDSYTFADINVYLIKLRAFADSEITPNEEDKENKQVAEGPKVDLCSKEKMQNCSELKKGQMFNTPENENAIVKCLEEKGAPDEFDGIVRVRKYTIVPKHQGGGNNENSEKQYKMKAKDDKDGINESSYGFLTNGKSRKDNTKDTNIKTQLEQKSKEPLKNKKSVRLVLSDWSLTKQDINAKKDSRLSFTKEISDLLDSILETSLIVKTKSEPVLAQRERDDVRINLEPKLNSADKEKGSLGDDSITHHDLNIDLSKQSSTAKMNEPSKLSLEESSLNEGLLSVKDVKMKKHSAHERNVVPLKDSKEKPSKNSFPQSSGIISSQFPSILEKKKLTKLYVTDGDKTTLDKGLTSVRDVKIKNSKTLSEFLTTSREKQSSKLNLLNAGEVCLNKDLISVQDVKLKQPSGQISPTTSSDFIESSRTRLADEKGSRFDEGFITAHEALIRMSEKCLEQSSTIAESLETRKKQSILNLPEGEKFSVGEGLITVQDVKMKLFKKSISLADELIPCLDEDSKIKPSKAPITELMETPSLGEDSATVQNSLKKSSKILSENTGRESSALEKKKRYVIFLTDEETPSFDQYFVTVQDAKLKNWKKRSSEQLPEKLSENRISYHLGQEKKQYTIFATDEDEHSLDRSFVTVQDAKLKNRQKFSGQLSEILSENGDRESLNHKKKKQFTTSLTNIGTVSIDKEFKTVRDVKMKKYLEQKKQSTYFLTNDETINLDENFITAKDVKLKNSKTYPKQSSTHSEKIIGKSLKKEKQQRYTIFSTDDNEKPDLDRNFIGTHDVKVKDCKKYTEQSSKIPLENRREYLQPEKKKQYTIFLTDEETASLTKDFVTVQDAKLNNLKKCPEQLSQTPSENKESLDQEKKNEPRSEETLSRGKGLTTTRDAKMTTLKEYSNQSSISSENGIGDASGHKKQSQSEINLTDDEDFVTILGIKTKNDNEDSKQFSNILIEKKKKSTSCLKNEESSSVQQDFLKNSKNESLQSPDTSLTNCTVESSLNITDEERARILKCLLICFPGLKQKLQSFVEPETKSPKCEVDKQKKIEE